MVPALVLTRCSVGCYRIVSAVTSLMEFQLVEPTAKRKGAIDEQHKDGEFGGEPLDAARIALFGAIDPQVRLAFILRGD